VVLSHHPWQQFVNIDSGNSRVGGDGRDGSDASKKLKLKQRLTKEFYTYILEAFKGVMSTEISERLSCRTSLNRTSRINSEALYGLVVRSVHGCSLVDNTLNKKETLDSSVRSLFRPREGRREAVVVAR
jgi:hypothetical protein